MSLQQAITNFAEAVGADMAQLERQRGMTPNVISTATIVPADHSYVVVGELTVDAELTIDGYLGIL